MAGHFIDHHPSMILCDTPHVIATCQRAVELRTTVDRDVLNEIWSSYRLHLVTLTKYDQFVLKRLLGKVDCFSPRQARTRYPVLGHSKMSLFDTIPYKLQWSRELTNTNSILKKSAIEGLKRHLLVEYVLAVRLLNRKLEALIATM